MNVIRAIGRRYSPWTVLTIGVYIALGLAAIYANQSANQAHGAEQAPSISLRADFALVPFGRASGLKGVALPPGEQVILEYWTGTDWYEFKRVDPVQGEYRWFFSSNVSPRDYRARYMGEVSETVTITLTDRIEIWHETTVTRYAEWIKIRGVGGGATGGWNGRTLHLQKWDKDRWKWVASAKTNSNNSGYIEIWFPAYSGGPLRIATEGSAIASNETVRHGSKIVAWQNSKVHGVLLDGYKHRVSGVGVYLQKWDPVGKRWVWEASGKTSADGYVNFTPKHNADYRLGTWASRVTSNVTNAQVRPVLNWLSRWPSNRTPSQYSEVEVYALAKDQNGEPIEGARAEFSWHFHTGIHRETTYTNASGVATSSYNIGGARTDVYVPVFADVTYRGVTIRRGTSFTPVSQKEGHQGGTE